MEASGDTFEGIEDAKDSTPMVIEGESSMVDERPHVSSQIQEGSEEFRNKQLQELENTELAPGLQLDPQSNPHKDLERKTTKIPRMIPTVAEHAEEFICALCLSLLFEPVTTPCGHTFCRSCLLLVMDQGTKCPLCRAILFISWESCSIDVTLNNVVKKLFPEEYAERKSKHERTIYHGDANFMPMYFKDLVLPCQKFALTVTDPSYIRLVRKIMEGNRRMGMTSPLTGPVHRIYYGACEVEITEFNPLPNGTIHLELESRRRFAISDINIVREDGYYVAEVQWIEDSDGLIYEHMQELRNKAAAFALAWMKIERKIAHRQKDERKLLELDRTESLMPTTQDYVNFSFWMTSLMPYSSIQKMFFLRIEDAAKRIMLALVLMRVAQVNLSVFFDPTWYISSLFS